MSNSRVTDINNCIVRSDQVKILGLGKANIRKWRHSKLRYLVFQFIKVNKGKDVFGKTCEIIQHLAIV